MKVFRALPLLLAIPLMMQAQLQPPPDEKTPKHILFIIPNNRTSPSLKEYVPLTTRQKFTVASQDSFDRGTVALAASFAGVGQLSNTNPSYGQGVQGYAKRFGASYADFVSGNYMTEGIYPSLLHQDPRYFRRATGTAWSRFAYSVGQVVLTHGDSGKTQFNYSEIAGNATAVGIGLSYSPDSRNGHDILSQFATQIAVDAASNVLKEFAPDLTRRFSRKKSDKN